MVYSIKKINPHGVQFVGNIGGFAKTILTRYNLEVCRLELDSDTKGNLALLSKASGDCVRRLAQVQSNVCLRTQVLLECVF